MKANDILGNETTTYERRGESYLPFYYVDLEEKMKDILWPMEITWLYKIFPQHSLGEKIYEEDLHIMVRHLGAILEKRIEDAKRV